MLTHGAKTHHNYHENMHTPSYAFLHAHQAALEGGLGHGAASVEGAEGHEVQGWAGDLGLVHHAVEEGGNVAGVLVVGASQAIVTHPWRAVAEAGWALRLGGCLEGPHRRVAGVQAVHIVGHDARVDCGGLLAGAAASAHGVAHVDGGVHAHVRALEEGHHGCGLVVGGALGREEVAMPVTDNIDAGHGSIGAAVRAKGGLSVHGHQAHCGQGQSQHNSCCLHCGDVFSRERGTGVYLDWWVAGGKKVGCVLC